MFALGMHQTMLARLVVEDLRASDAVTGVVQALSMLAGVALLFSGGAVADRSDPRRMLFVTHLLGALPVLVLAAAVAMEMLSLPLLLVCAVAYSAFNPYAFPAREAMCWRLGSAHIERAVAAHTMAQFGSQAVGMRMVDFARVFGSAPILAVQGIVCAAGALFARPLPRLPKHHGPAHPGLADTLAGARFVWRTDLRWIWIFVFGIGMFFGGAFWTGMPLLLRARFGHVNDLGALLWLFQIGTMLGSGWLIWRGGIRRKGRAIVMALVCGAGGIMLLAQPMPFWLMQVVMLLWGLAGAMFINMGRALFQARAPDAERARVMAMNQFGFISAAPIGSVLTGSLSEWLGPQVTLLVLGGAMYVLIVVGVWRAPVWRMR